MDQIFENNKIREHKVYIAGKYSAQSSQEVEENVSRAKEYSAKIWQMGFTGISPHMLTHFPEDLHKDMPNVDWMSFMLGDLNLLKSCDAIFMMPGWKESKGAMIEYFIAMDNGITILHNEEELELYRQICVSEAEDLIERIEPEELE